MGFLTSLANPKVAVMYLSLLPQFIVRHGSVLVQSLALGTIQIMISLTVNGLIILDGRFGGCLYDGAPVLAGGAALADGDCAGQGWLSGWCWNPGAEGDKQTGSQSRSVSFPLLFFAAEPLLHLQLFFLCEPHSQFGSAPERIFCGDHPLVLYQIAQLGFATGYGRITARGR